MAAPLPGLTQALDRMAEDSAIDPDKALSQLIDAWCERRALDPLRIILNCYPRVSGLTDEWAALAKGLKTIRVRHGDKLAPQELETVITLQHLADSVVYR